MSERTSSDSPPVTLRESDDRGRTQESYDVIAAAFHERTRDSTRGRPWLDRFAAVLRPGSLVADVGSGPGRDTAELRARGLRAFCLDRSIGMLRAGLGEFPAERIRADVRALPLRSASVDGVWANASLLHLSADDLSSALREIRRVIVATGQLHLSVKHGDGVEWESEQYDRPRFFQYWRGADLDAALHESGFAICASAFEPSRTADWLIRHCAVADAGGTR